MPVLSPEEFERIDKLLAASRPTTPVTPAPVAEESIPISQYPAEILKGAISGSTAELADLALRKGYDSNILDPATEGWGPYHVGYGLGSLIGLPNRFAIGGLGLASRLLPKASLLKQAAVAGGLANAPVAAISAAVQGEDPLAAAGRGAVIGAGLGAAGSKLEPLLERYFGRLAPSFAAKTGAAVDEVVPPGTPPVTETVAGLPPRTPPPDVKPPTGPRPAPTPRETFAEAQARAQEEIAKAPPVPPLERPFGPTRMPPPRKPVPETPEAPVSPTITSTRKKGSGKTYAETVNPPPVETPVPAMGWAPEGVEEFGKGVIGQNLKGIVGGAEEGLPELPTESYADKVVNAIGAHVDEQFPDTIENGVLSSAATERNWVRRYVRAKVTGEKPPKVTVEPFFKELADKQLKDRGVALKQQAETPRIKPAPPPPAPPTQMTMPPTPTRLTNVVSQGLAPGGEAFEHPAVSGLFGMPPTQAAVQYGTRAPIPAPAPEDAFRLPAAQTLWGGSVIPEPLPEPLPPVTYTPRAVPTATKPQPLPEPTPLPEPLPAPAAFEPLPLPDEGLPPLPLPEAATRLPVTPEPVVTPTVQAPSIDEKLYEQAKKLIAKEEQVSRTLLQRRMKIGFDRAEGILNRLEQEGLVSPPLQGEYIGVQRQVLAPAAAATPTPVPTPKLVQQEEQFSGPWRSTSPAPSPTPTRRKQVDLTKAATLPIETTEPIKTGLENLNQIRKEMGLKQSWAVPISKDKMLKQLQREQEANTVEDRLEDFLTPLLPFAEVPGLTKRLGKPYGPLLETLAKNWHAATSEFDPAAYRLELAQQQIPARTKALLKTGGSEAMKQRRAIQLAIKLRKSLGGEGAETEAGVIPAGQFEGLSDIEKVAALPGGKIGSEASAVLSKAMVDLVGPGRAQQLVQLVNTATDDKTLMKRATALFKTALPAAAVAAGVTALQPDVAQAIQQEAPKLQNDPAATYLKLNDMGHTNLTMEDVEQALQTPVSPAKKKAVRKLTPQAKKTYLDLTTTEEDMAA